MNIENIIENTIVNEVFRLFTEKKFEEAQKLLYDMYLHNCNDIPNLSKKRLLIYNLAWVEDELGNNDSAKKYITEIKDEVEKDKNFISDNKLEYYLVLNLYLEIFKHSIDIEEYKEINTRIANFHRETGSLGRECVALANVHLADKRWNDVISLILKLKDHKINEYFIDRILESLAKNNIEAFNKAKDLLNGGDINV
jgi:tetratricopeptide (TPR) repeat protein